MAEQQSTFMAGIEEYDQEQKREKEQMLKKKKKASQH